MREPPSKTEARRIYESLYAKIKVHLDFVKENQLGISCADFLTNELHLKYVFSMYYDLIIDLQTGPINLSTFSWSSLTALAADSERIEQSLSKFISDYEDQESMRYDEDETFWSSVLASLSIYELNNL